MPEAFWDADKGEAKGEDLAKHLETLEAAKKAADERAAKVPAKPEDYQLAVPEDFKLPEGFELNPDDPRLEAVRAAAHEAGITQEAFAKLVAADLKGRIAEAAAEAAFRDKAMKALGQNAQARVDALAQSITARVGEENAPHLIALLVGDKQVRAMEQLLQSSPSFSAGGRDGAPEPGKIPGYENMTFRQRMQAAETARQRRAG